MPSASSLFRHLRYIGIACAAILWGGPVLAASPAKAVPSETAVIEHYADLAAAIFGDAHQEALSLQQAVQAFLKTPSAETLTTAKAAWRRARVPYMQTEVFRFGNPVVDDWEGQLNAWPLDEGLIDYVSSDYTYALGNIGATLNIIANPVIELGGARLDTTTLSAAVIADLNELGGSEANVATGYHAIEFLLWGQDLHGHALGAGERPYTDYVEGDGCTHGNCDRRRQYLAAATQLLVDDLQYMAGQWQPGDNDNYRETFLSLAPSQALARIFYGMGSLSLGELGGERIKVALEANSTEDEHDCFSDNTHWSHYYNGLGIENIFLGRYQRADNSVLSGPSLQGLVAAKNAAASKATVAALADSMAALKKLTDVAEAQQQPQKFDMLVAEGNEEGHQLLADILAALVTQTRSLEQAAAAIDIDPNQLGY